jgi:pimeloyl-ACP methyl ester carboxylesterase
VPWLVRAGFATVSAVAPSMAAAAAERLFLTPPRRRRPRRERDAVASGDPFVVAFGRERLHAWRFGEGPAVLLVHGWGGRAGQLASFIPPLVAAGCAVVAFDAPAHGKSTGATASLPVFAEALSTVAARFGARAAVGHSVGAAGVGLALGQGLQLDAAVLLSPPRSPAEYFLRFCDALGLRHEVRDAARARLERRYGVVLEHFDLPGHVARTSTPLLVVHDRDDREVPWSDGFAIARSRPDAALVSTEGLGHGRILRDESVAASTAAFVWKHLARCACGRLAEDDGGPEARCAQCALERELFHRPSRWISRQ